MPLQMDMKLLQLSDTLAVLAVLNFIGDVGQEYDLVRNITYWLSITGRAYPFIDGLIASDNVFYFLIVIGFFLALSILKLNTEKSIMPLKTKVLKYSGIVLVTLVLGYVSSTPYTKSIMMLLIRKRIRWPKRVKK